MSLEPLSRRAFFGQAAAVPAAGLIPAVEKPQRAWIIVALDWEHNDEFTYENGRRPQDRLFYDKGQADAECRRLCDAFFADQTPEEFQVDFEAYLPERFIRHDFEEQDVTWEELTAGGFPDPYCVLELTTPEGPSP